MNAERSIVAAFPFYSSNNEDAYEFKANEYVSANEFVMILNKKLTRTMHTVIMKVGATEV